MVMKKKLSKTQVGLKYGFKSGLEEEIAQQLVKEGIQPKYETRKMPYKVEKDCTYTPDFPVSDSIIIETKGRFMVDDRMKMLRLKQQYPDVDFRFVFTNSKARITKKSKTTYGMWCEKYGFKYADKAVPKEWLQEIKEVLKNEKDN